MTKHKRQSKAGTSPENKSQRAVAAKIGISPGRLSQLKREGCPVNSAESAREWIEARAKAIGKGERAPSTLNDARLKKIGLECQLLLIEINRKQNPDSGSIPAREVRQALETFLWVTGTSARQRAEQTALNFHGADLGTLIRELERFADSSHYAGLGAALETACPEFVQIVREILRGGDHRYAPGKELAAACIASAKNVAREILRDEITAAPPSKSQLAAEIGEIMQRIKIITAEFSRRGRTEAEMVGKFWEEFRKGLKSLSEEESK